MPGASCISTALTPALALLALLTCGGAGEARAAAAPSADEWRAATAQTLVRLREPGPPYLTFLSATRPPSLVPVLEASLARKLAGGARDRAVERFVLGFFDRREGLFVDDRSDIPPLVTTWLAFRVLTADERRMAVRARVSRALRIRRTSNGSFAWSPGGDPDPVARLYARRVASLLDVALPSTEGAARAACLPRLSAGGTWYVEFAIEAEVRTLEGAPCAPTRRVRTLGVQAARLLAIRLERRAGIPELERARALVQLERLGLLPGGTTSPLSQLIRDRLGRRRPPGDLEGTAVTALRVALDVIGPEGKPVRLAPRARLLLDRAIRFRGTLPERLASRDALEAVLGLHALAFLEGATPRSVKVSPAAAPLDRLVLGLGTARRIPPSLLEEAADAGLGSGRLRDVAIVALAAGRSEARCGEAGERLSAAIRSLSAKRSKLRRASALDVYWVALIVNGAQRCEPRAAVLLPLLRERLRALAKTRTRIELLGAWWLAEARCLLSGKAALERAAVQAIARVWRRPGGGARIMPSSSSVSVLHTYALLRLESLAAHGCGGAWWEGWPRR